MKTSKFLLLSSSCILLSAFSCIQSQAAEDIDYSDWRFGGYASQSLIYTSDNNLFGNSDDGVSTDFSELGLYLSGVYYQLQMSAALLSRRALNNDDGTPEIDHFFLSWNFYNDLRWGLSLRAGKLKAPLGFYNDTRDMPFARNSILLPQSVYFERFRNSLLRHNGVELYAHRGYSQSTLTWQVDLTRQKPDPDDINQFFGSGEFWSNDGLSAGTGGFSRIMYDFDEGRFRLGYSAAAVNYHVSELNQNQVDASFAAYFGLYSAQYNTDQFSLTGEFLDIRLHQGELLQVDEQNFNGYSWYLQGVWRWNPKIESFIRYSSLYFNEDDRKGEQFEQKMAPLFTLLGINSVPGYATFSQNWSLGLGWHITPDWLARLEFYTVDGAGWLPDLNVDGTGSLVRQWDAIMTQISYRF